MDLDRLSSLKENLVDSGDGSFVSKNDPGIWRKLLAKNPGDGKAQYNAALGLEEEARIYLEKYRETGIAFFLRLHRQKSGEALGLLRKSWSSGYLPAGGELLRLGAHSQSENSSRAPGPWPKRLALGAFLLLCFLLGAALSLWLFSGKTEVFKEITREYHAYLIPYRVIEGRPAYVPNFEYDLKTTVLRGDLSRESIANDLVYTIKKMYEADPETPKKVTTVAEGEAGRAEVGMAVWPGGKSDIFVYVYPPDMAAAPAAGPDIAGDRLLWETTTVVRSALYQYARRNGRMPGSLSDLTGPYPDNYLTAIPRDPYYRSNSVHSSPTGLGGWVYTPEAFDSSGGSVSRALVPDLPGAGDIPFAPLDICIDKSSNLLAVRSGGKVIRTYPAALGKEGRTPEGKLFIAGKLMNPDPAAPVKKLYGTRVMELSDRSFAIHGTDSPDSVGKNVSLGCIRLYSPDMEDLYAMAPLYSPVLISGGGLLPGSPPETGSTAGYRNSQEMTPYPGYAHNPGASPNSGPPPESGELYAKEFNPSEAAGVVTFNWRG